MSMGKKLRNCVASLFSFRSGLAGLALLPLLFAGTPELAQTPTEQPSTVVTGALGEDLVRNTILPHLDEVRRCVDFGSAAELQLGGQVRVSFKIAASGTVAAARIKPSPLRDPQIEQCILTLLKTWSFPKQGGGTRVTYPFELFSTDDDVILPSERGLAQVKGSLSKELVRDGIVAHIGQVKTCYEQGTAARSNRNGRLMVKFLIASSGVVAASGLQSSTLEDPQAEQCITDAIKGWTFARPQGGSVLVSYPFVLKVRGEEGP
jgi:TonB family protein